MRILVACGGGHDRDVLCAAGFHDVLITGIGCSQADAKACEPFSICSADVQQLPFGDGSFDLTVVNYGLHHCRSPHRALLELYRVSRKGVLVLESRDSLPLRAAIGIGAASAYEMLPVILSNCQSGGVDNTPVPNFVYHWTEREVTKCIQSRAPEALHRIHFFYGLEIDTATLKMNCGSLKYLAVCLAEPFLQLTARVIPRWGNRFAFFIEKPQYPRDLQPWITIQDGKPVMNETCVAGHPASRATERMPPTQ